MKLQNTNNNTILQFNDFNATTKYLPRFSVIDTDTDIIHDIEQENLYIYIFNDLFKLQSYNVPAILLN